MKTILSFVLLSALFVGPAFAVAAIDEMESVCVTVCALAVTNEEGVKEISYDQFQQMIASGEEMVIVDALAADAYAQGHIPGAVNMPADAIAAATAESAIPSVETPVVVYCANFNCHASTRAAQALTALGYINVVDYKGGKKEWSEKGNALES